MGIIGTYFRFNADKCVTNTNFIILFCFYWHPKSYDNGNSLEEVNKRFPFRQVALLLKDYAVMHRLNLKFLTNVADL